MCYGDSIHKTCPRCSSFDQIFELRGCCSIASPTKTWWILPCAIVEEVPVAALCEGCLRCFDWLGELDTADLPYPSTMNSDNIPRTPVDAAESLEFGDEITSIASMAKRSTRSEIPYTSSNHPKVICEWYDTIETSLLPLRQTLSRMSARCITTKNASLIAKLGILEAEVEVTLSTALADLEYVIETNTWIRHITSDETKLHTVEAEELRHAMFEMRMRYIGLVEDVSAETITKKLWNEAYEFCDLLEGVQEEMMIKNEASGRSQVLEDAGESNLMSRVKSLIWC